MSRLILIGLIALTACGHRSETAQRASDSFSVMSGCQLQSVQPAPQYGADVSLKTYLCSQFRPSCLIGVLSSPVFNQVPAIVSNTCPQNPPFNQVPPGGA